MEECSNVEAKENDIPIFQLRSASTPQFSPPCGSGKRLTSTTEVTCATSRRPLAFPSVTRKSMFCANESILQVARHRGPANLPGRNEDGMKRKVVVAAYVLEIVGDIEATLRGPYKNTDTRDRAAKRLREKDAEKENGIFALDLMKNGKLHIWAYSAGFLDEAVATAEEIRFINHYQCPDDRTEWTDRWNCACNDKCPTCNKEIEPYEAKRSMLPASP